MPNASAGIEDFADFVEALQAGDIYANVHTMTHMGGEIRGQVLAPTTFTGLLTGEQEVPPVPTTATGQSRVVLAPDGSSLNVVLTTTLPANQITQAHIEVGPAGEDGSVAFILAAAGFANPRLVTLTPADFLPSPAAPTYEAFLAALRAQMTFVNVRTGSNPNGEIRAQLLAPLTLTAMLDGDQEVPPVTTTASGRGQVVINADRDRMRFALTVTMLPTDQILMAHIHTAPIGMNGGVAFFLADSSFSSPLLGTLTEDDFLPTPEAPTYADFLGALFGGETYMNVHTIDNTDGEIRGQLEDSP